MTKKGKKFDFSKAKMSLLPFEALREIANILTFGCDKYGRHNWRDGMEWSRIQDAMLRHYERFSLGEDRDPETGSLHLAHLATNALFLLTYQLLKLGTDDRWKNSYNPSDLLNIKNKKWSDLDPDKRKK